MGQDKNTTRPSDPPGARGTKLSQDAARYPGGSASSGLFAKKEEPASESGTGLSYTAADLRAHRARLSEEEERRNASSSNALAAVTTGSAAASVGAMALLGGTLLPALLITSGVTGVFIGYQYFTKSGLFKEPEPMLPDQGSMLVRGGANPGQEMQAMIDSESARLKAERAAASGQMEIEVPQTPTLAKADRRQKADQRQGMQPPPGNKGLS